MSSIADVQDLTKIETAKTLKKILALWPHIHQMNITLLSLYKGENFLTAMTMIQPGPIITPSSRQEIQEKTDLLAHHFFKIQKDSTIFPDLKFLNNIWHLKTDSALIQKIVSFFNRDIKIPASVMQYFDQCLEKLNKTEYDFSLKIFYLHYLVSNILYNLGMKELHRPLRIFNIKAFADQGFIRYPAFYQDYLLTPTLNLNEESLLHFLHDFTSIICLANLVLQHVTDLYHELTDNISHLEIVKKIDKSPEFFPHIFSKPVISISDVIHSMSWKRDKAARFLNQLVKTGYFSMEKIGREKVFFNLTLLRIIENVKEDHSILEILY